jgi:hypothetical protein
LSFVLAGERLSVPGLLTQSTRSTQAIQAILEDGTWELLGLDRFHDPAVLLLLQEYHHERATVTRVNLPGGKVEPHEVWTTLMVQY